MQVLRNALRNQQQRTQRRRWRWFSRSAGLLSLLMSIAMCAFVAPASVGNGVAAARMARPATSALSLVPPGERVLVAAIVPDAREAAAGHGFGAYVVETREQAGNAVWRFGETQPAVGVWRTPDEVPISVRLNRATQLHQAQVFEDHTVDTRQMRYRGYLPGRVVTLAGTRSDNDFLVEAVYPGTPDDYVRFLSVTQPLQLVGAALLCAGFGVVLLVAGLVTRLLGRLGAGLAGLL